MMKRKLNVHVNNKNVTTTTTTNVQIIKETNSQFYYTIYVTGGPTKFGFHQTKTLRIVRLSHWIKKKAINIKEFYL